MGTDKAQESIKCIKLLMVRYNELGRPPKKSDFSTAEVVAIKRAFGPWPRALEKAGLKAVTLNRQRKLARKNAKNKQEKNQRTEQPATI